MPRRRGERGRVKRIKVWGQWCWRGHWHPYGPNGRRTSAVEDLGPCSERTRLEAEDALRAIIRDREQCPIPRPNPIITVRDLYVEVFLPPRVAGWSRNTRHCLTGQWPQVEQVGGVVGNHILPALGDMLLADIRKKDLERLLLSLRDRGLGKQLLGHVRFLLHSAFEEALENELIARSPASRLRVPDAPESETRALVWEEAARLFHAPLTLTLLMARLLIECGLRLGECLALRWNDIQPGQLRLDEQWTALEIKGKLKTGQSVAYVPLPESLRAALLVYRQSEWRNGEPDFLFPSPQNPSRPLGHQRARNRLKKLGQSVGIPDLTAQVCRRTYATFMERRLSPRDLAAVMRHSDPAMSLRHYAKPLPEVQRAAVEDLDRELFGGDGEGQVQ